MQHPIAPVHPLRFGRRAPRAIALPIERKSSFSDDLKLFALTFGAGFVFVSVYLV
jgi:hypothetical protein